MSEATVVIDKVFTKEGEKNGKSWKRYDIKDRNENRYSTFNATQGELAEHGVGKRFKLIYEESQFGNNLKEISGPVEEETPPTPGAGNYIRSTPASAELKGKAVNTALMQAVAAMTHTITPAMTPKEASERILPLAAAFLLWNLEQNNIGPEIGSDDNIPFGDE
jgi:hypothetical protein